MNDHEDTFWRFFGWKDVESLLKCHTQRIDIVRLTSQQNQGKGKVNQNDPSPETKEPRHQQTAAQDLKFSPRRHDSDWNCTAKSSMSSKICELRSCKCLKFMKTQRCKQSVLGGNWGFEDVPGFFHWKTLKLLMSFSTMKMHEHAGALRERNASGDHCRDAQMDFNAQKKVTLSWLLSDGNSIRLTT